MASNHTCAAIGCFASVRYGLLMCPPHWKMVQRGVQGNVYNSFRAWNTGGSVRGYFLSVTRAQLAVAKVEGQPPAVLAPMEKALEDARETRKEVARG